MTETHTQLRTRRRNRPPSPAVMLLAQRGHVCADLAKEIGCHEHTVAQYLRGYRRLTPALTEALERMVGPTYAASILDAIPDPANRPAA